MTSCLRAEVASEAAKLAEVRYIEFASDHAEPDDEMTDQIIVGNYTGGMKVATQRLAGCHRRNDDGIAAFVGDIARLGLVAAEGADAARFQNFRQLRIQARGKGFRTRFAGGQPLPGGETVGVFLANCNPIATGLSI